MAPNHCRDFAGLRWPKQAKTGQNRPQMTLWILGPFCKILSISGKFLVAASGLEPLTPAL
jgi:hypothetical protein